MRADFQPDNTDNDARQAGNTHGAGGFAQQDYAGERRAYRTATPDAEHLGGTTLPQSTALEKEIRIAELRANEFMGSLLVPRQRIIAAVEELAPQHDITIHRHPSTDPDHPGTALRIKANGDLGVLEMDRFEKALATRFGVNPRFIQVRLNRYGLTTQEATMR